MVLFMYSVLRLRLLVICSCEFVFIYYDFYGFLEHIWFLITHFDFYTNFYVVLIASHGMHMNCKIIVRVHMICLWVSLDAPMILLWYSYDIAIVPMIVIGFTMCFICLCLFFLRLPGACLMIVLWLSYGIPIVIYGISWYSYGCPMLYLW